MVIKWILQWQVCANTLLCVTRIHDVHENQAHSDDNHDKSGKHIKTKHTIANSLIRETALVYGSFSWINKAKEKGRKYEKSPSGWSTHIYNTHIHTHTLLTRRHISINIASAPASHCVASAVESSVNWAEFEGISANHLPVEFLFDSVAME